MVNAGEYSREQYKMLREYVNEKIDKHDWYAVRIASVQLEAILRLYPHFAEGEQKPIYPEHLSVKELKRLYASPSVDQATKDEELAATLDAVTETIMAREECSREVAEQKAERWIKKKLKALDDA